TGNLYVTGTGTTGASITPDIDLGSASKEINVSDGAALVDASFTGKLFNGGGSTSQLIKENLGSAQLGSVGTAVDSTFTSQISDKQGALFIDATLNAPSTVTVDAGATFGGRGTIPAAVTVNGTLNPGIPATIPIVGTLTTGNL